MKEKGIVKTFDSSVMRIIYTMGYLLVPGPKPLEYQLGWKDLNPLRIIALAIVSLMLAAILIVSSLVALLFSPLFYRCRY